VQDFDSFRCKADNNGGPQCISTTRRCNGNYDCEDHSDELACTILDPLIPAVDVPVECPAIRLDHLHVCPRDISALNTAPDMCVSAASQCADLVNTCNVADASCACSGVKSLPTAVATSGRTASVIQNQCEETIATKVFHDRDYEFDSLGFFDKKMPYVMQSNDDRTLDQLHVTLKVTVHEPTKFYVVTLGDVPWVEASNSGWTPESLATPTYSGDRHPFLQAGGSGLSPILPDYNHAAVPNGGHSAWFDLGLTVPVDLNGQAVESTFPRTSPVIAGTPGNTVSRIYSKLFPAGVANLPGNSDVGGTYLLFLQGLACFNEDQVNEGDR